MAEVQIGGLMFRDVKDGDMCPYNFHTEAPEVLRWLCPSLTMAEAAALARLGWGMSVTVENMRRLVLRNIEKVRASGVTLRDEDGEKATISIPASGPPTGALPVRIMRAAEAIAEKSMREPVSTIGEPIPWRLVTGLELREGSTYLVVYRRSSERPPSENVRAVEAIFAAFDCAGIASVVMSLPADAPLEIRPAEGAMADEIARLRAHPSPSEVAELLRAVEWHACDDMEAPRCVSCGGKSSLDVGTGHDADCKLAAMLRRCEGV